MLRNLKTRSEYFALAHSTTKGTTSVCVCMLVHIYISTHTYICHIHIYTIDIYLYSLYSVITVTLHNLTCFLPLAILTQFLLSKSSAPNWWLSDKFLNAIPFQSILELDKFLEINWILILWSPKKETTRSA